MAERYVQECIAKDLDHEFQLSTYNQRVSIANPERDHCGCKGFEFRRRCKHVTEARETVCDWTELTSEIKQDLNQEVGCVCPKCGGATNVVRTEE